jgi:hypothetical protein
MRTTSEYTVSPSSVALRIVSLSGRSDWLLLVVPGDGASGAIDALAGSVRTLGGQVTTVDVTGRAAEDVVKAVAGCGPGTVLLVYGLERLTDEEWRHIDLLRSRLTGIGTIVLVGSGITAERIGRNAPNLASWIAGSMWTLNPGADALTNEERNERLKALRRWSKMRDEDVVRRAEDGTLPDDPEYTEWLILLDRADLVAS